MIKVEKVLVGINYKNRDFYSGLGYDVDNCRSIEVLTTDLNESCRVKIVAICEICKSENNIMNSKYHINKNRNNKGYYTCFDCKSLELEKTCLRKYGVKSYSQTKEFRESESVKWKGIQKGSEKGKKTMLEKYGVDSFFKTEEMREANRKWMSSDEFKFRSKESLINKYGVDSFTKTPEFKTSMSLKKDSTLIKIRETFLKKYGKEWLSNTPEVLLKVSNTKIKNGHKIPDDDLTEFNIYRRQVRNITNGNLKTLYDNWDGYDYYDREFIFGNLLMYESKDRLYPSVDHKISIYHGFMNKIDPYVIGSIDNLCITKRSINSAKRHLTEDEYLKSGLESR